MVFDTARPVIALDVRDGSFAWVAATPTYSAHCESRLWVWRRGRDPEQLPFPAKYAAKCMDADGPTASVALSSAAVAWTIDDEGGNSGEMFFGASTSSLGRAVSFAHEFTDGGAGPAYSGELVAGLAATSAGIVFGDANLLPRALVPSADECDLNPKAVARAVSRAAASGSGAAGASTGCRFNLPPRLSRMVPSSRSSRGRGATVGSAAASTAARS